MDLSVQNSMSSYTAFDNGGNGDPYFSTKNDIQAAVERFTNDFDSWDNMLENTNTHQNKSFKELTDSLKSQYKQINRSLKELTKTISTVESNRSNFQSITNQDLHERKSFVRDMKSAITDCRDKMQSPKTRDIIDQHKREFQVSKQESVQERFSRQQNDQHIDGHVQEQQLEEKKQDEILDDMHATLKRLGVHANTINVEIDSQMKLLDEVDEEMTITGDRLTRLTQKLDDLMGQSNSKKICLIVLLVVILAGLIYFIL